MKDYPEKQQHIFHPYSKDMAHKVSDIAMALMYGLRIKIGNTEYIMDGGSEITKVATVEENGEIIGETLLGYWDGNLSILVDLAKKMTKEQHLTILSDIALNNIHWSGDSAEEILEAITIDASVASEPTIHVDGEKVEIMDVNMHNQAVIHVGKSDHTIGVMYDGDISPHNFQQELEEIEALYGGKHDEDS